MKLLSKVKSKHVAIEIDGKCFLYSELTDKITACEHALDISFPKLKSKDLILTFLDNSLDFISLFYAIINYNGIFFPVDTNLPIKNLQKLIKIRNIKYFVTQKKYLSIVSTIKHCTVIYIEDIIKTQVSLKIKESLRRKTSKVICQLTSGSTGESKLSFRTLESLVQEAKSVAKRLELKLNDKLFCPLKLSHSFALTTCMTSVLYIGGAFATTSKFTPDNLINQLLPKTTIFAATPYIYKLLLKIFKNNFKSYLHLRLIISAGASLDAKTYDSFKNLTSLRICQLYGSTETGALTINHPFDNKDHLSVGKPFEHVKITVEKDGIIKILKNNFDKAYVFDKGQLSVHGNIIIFNRLDDTLEINGRKIVKEEIVSVLKKFPNIIDVQVFKLDHKGLDVIKINYVSDKKINVNNLYEFCVKSLPAYMVPKKYIRVSIISKGL